jgi:hypothetical protein
MPSPTDHVQECIDRASAAAEIMEICLIARRDNDALAETAAGR